MKTIMKKIIFIAITALVSFGTLNAQDTTFGASAGYYNLNLKVSEGSISASTSASGFYVGLFADIEVGESFSIQPELQFGSTSVDGESVDQILVPIMFKYNISDEFNIHAGPQLDFVVSESEGLNAFGLGLGFGIGYDISDQFFISTNYALGLTNRLEDAPSDFSLKFNTFQAGIGYRF